MLEQIVMPQLGESVHEGTINKWFVTVGDKIEKYAPLVEVISDKVTAEVPSSFTGTIKEIFVNEGTTVEVGTIICTIETGSEKQEKMEVKKEEESNHIEPFDPLKRMGNKNRYSPAVLKLAQEHGIDLNEITGTGLGGRVTRKDVLQWMKNKEHQPTKHDIVEKVDERQQVATTHLPPTFEHTEQTVLKEDVHLPVTGIRKAIADRMVVSKHEIPHAWLMVEVDVTNLVQYRNAEKERFKEKEGFPLTYFPFFVKAVAQTLKEFPQLNATWAGDKIIQKKDINISIAVGTDEALYVPVIKHADEKSIKGIARQIYEFSSKARNNALTYEDMEGGTFTVNNTGTFGSIQSMGIINHPQAALLQVESIVKRPVVINDMIAIRDIVNLCLSIDHRVLDGVISGRFLQRLKEVLEKISKESTPIY